MNDTDTRSPTWAVAPGEILLEALEERGMTQAELGRRMARPLKTISEIARGKAAVTPETAIQLERVLGISAATWLGLESRYREAQARERDFADLQDHVVWMKNFPLGDLVSREIISPHAPPATQAAQLLSFFGVSSPAGWDQHWGQIAASYRMSERLRVSPYSVAIWIREAEREAERMAKGRKFATYSPSHLTALVPELRPLSRALVVGGAIEKARELLWSAGVGLVLVQGVLGAPASGALRWIRGYPWIVLTLRLRTDDQLWFSLLHEIGHLLEGGRRREVVEALDDSGSPGDSEQAANQFAREALLPQMDFDDWLEEHPISRLSIRAFAEVQDVAPGIVVGRLQRDGRISSAQFNDLKRRVAT